MIEPRSRGVLDSPPEPVIGLAEGETRWRGMTTFGYDGLAVHTPAVWPMRHVPPKRKARRTSMPPKPPC